ncbi:MAG: iron-sulfur cluster carrier protein ApbC [Anderseniella sp.]|jgi:ATP-binding protein involved in chromosome partitioning|nr:iron-sulfur cluster carrier protein ApbC [Anderseniella sp.]
MIEKQDVMTALSKVRGPDLEGNLVSLGLVSDPVISGDSVMFAITVDARRAAELEPLRQAAEKAVSKVPGVNKVMAALTAEVKGGSKPAAGRTPPPAGANMAPPPPMAERGAPGPKAQAAQTMAGVPGVRHIVAVASGKGGVGKSTTAVNLALGLQANGLKVGILDADIYGPSVPRLLGITGRPEPVAPGSRTLKPLQGFGLQAMSMGFLVEEDTPMIWRGPMVMSALQQMLREVAWGDLDVLIVDMPPGTGDAQLTLAQQTPLSGAVIVSTPQDLALIDARKGLNMFRRVDVPVLGIVENMSFFVCTKCGERHEIFGHGGARDEAEKLGLPFLGEVPLDKDLRIRSDAGQPIVVSAPDSLHAGIYRDIAAKIWASIEGDAAGQKRAAPRIIVE